MAKDWIKGAIKKPGALTAAAKSAGKSISEYCQNLILDMRVSRMYFASLVPYRYVWSSPTNF